MQEQSRTGSQAQEVGGREDEHEQRGSARTRAGFLSHDGQVSSESPSQTFSSQSQTHSTPHQYHHPAHPGPIVLPPPPPVTAFPVPPAAHPLAPVLLTDNVCPSWQPATSSWTHEFSDGRKYDAARSSTHHAEHAILHVPTSATPRIGCARRPTRLACSRRRRRERCSQQRRASARTRPCKGPTARVRHARDPWARHVALIALLAWRDDVARSPLGPAW